MSEWSDVLFFDGRSGAHFFIEVQLCNISAMSLLCKHLCPLDPRRTPTLDIVESTAIATNPMDIFFSKAIVSLNTIHRHHFRCEAVVKTVTSTKIKPASETHTHNTRRMKREVEASKYEQINN
eukprot:2570574-Amphidinium_carterae.1